MAKKSTRRNPFEALCALASKEGWCWKLTCITCNHMYFRYGFMELARGKHPDGPDWIVSNSRREELYPTLGRGWNDTRGPSEEAQPKLRAARPGSAIWDWA